LAGKLIRITRGDITESEADAIVNAANNHLWMGAGVAGAIKRKGGQEIENEAVSKGPIQVGEAVVTTAGSLGSKCVIHAAAMGQDLKTDENKIWMATYNSLLRAEELNLESIDLPALGTGVGGFPLERAAEIMIKAVKDYLKDSSSLKKVGFVLFDDAAFNAFKNTLGADIMEV
jgi:O-acetyl-ADP-ribose deacetylase (regulator of RNase III)